MPIRKVKDEVYILENELLSEFARYVMEHHPHITSKFVSWYKLGFRKEGTESEKETDEE